MYYNIKIIYKSIIYNYYNLIKLYIIKA